MIKSKQMSHCKLHLTLAAMMLAFCGCKRVSTCPANIETQFISKAKISEHLGCAVPKDPWAGVPEPYQGWAQRQLDARMDVAVGHLVQDYDQTAVEHARQKVVKLVRIIRKYATHKCTIEECTGRLLEPPPIEEEMEADMCPGVFPFC